jgi:hypothetical protein
MKVNPAKKLDLSREAVVVASQDQAFTNLEDEAVILNLKDGIYYGLDPVGGRIWNLLQKPRKFGEILKILLEEYEVAPERCEQDLMRLLGELAARGLIVIRDGPSA